jgi:solute carrier family 35 protein E1
MLFGVKYSATTYISLFPLTVGVMLACTFDMSASNPLGLVCAFGSAIIFVSSNIFFKKIMPTQSSSNAGSAATTSHRLDKINLLFYSSGLAFIMMIPIWLYYDFVPLINHWSSGSIVSANRHVHSVNPDAKTASHSVAYYFFMNGTVHFLQNVIAFAILATTSPVTYSIASLIKRIAVICIAIVWFAQSIHPVQGFGICLTFVGLWMYNRAKGDVERGEKMARKVEAMRDMILPSTKEELEVLNGPTNGLEEKYPVPTLVTGTEFREAQQRGASVQIQPPHLQQMPVHQPRKPGHGRTYSRENPPSLPALNTTLAASNYVPKYIPVFSPPTEEVNNTPMVDPYPSPPKSLDSPPPELDELIASSSAMTKGVEVLSASSQARNRRGTIQNQRTMETIPVH